MKTIDLIQGTTEWHAHRASHFNASDAPAMMGCSPYKTRTQLLHELKTGMKPEVDAATQRRFDDGHRFEALARPLAEDIIGEELYPVTGSEGNLSASFDGLTMMEDVAFEHKTLNADLIAYFDDLQTAAPQYRDGRNLPQQYQVQIEQQLMISGAGKCLFMASKWQGDELVEERHCWYYPDEELREQIIAGWAQFEIDLAAYVLTEVVQAAVGRTPDTLPALHIEVTGMVTASNMAEFKETAIAAIKSVNRDLKTDQDFADNAKAIKWCSDIETRVKAAKEHALGQTASIDALFRTMDEISAEARATRLELEKLDTAKKLQVKTDMVQKAKDELALHIKQLNAGLGGLYLGGMGANFADVIKGKKTVDSMQNAVDTEMARVKIEANATADKIQMNLATLVELSSDYKHLFSDTAKIVLKAPDDLTALVKSRIFDFKASEEKRLEAEREKIRSEEVAKLAKEQADQDALAERLATDAKREQDRQEHLAAVALIVRAEVKPEPIAPVVAQKPKRTAVAKSQPVYTESTRDKLNLLLDQMAEANLMRTLHFVQTRFFSVKAA